MKQFSKIFVGTVLCICLVSGLAFAEKFGFYNITGNIAGDAAIGEDQLFMDVSLSSNNTVVFTFTNEGPAASSITDIYFDDDVPLLTYIKFIESAGVEFTVGASPKDLPGGQSYSFTTTYSYDSDNPTQPKGVNPGEYLGIVFALNNTDYTTVLSALSNESFRVGIHVQGFATGGSESFINAPVPEPATILLLGIGIVGLVAYKRKNS